MEKLEIRGIQFNPIKKLGKGSFGVVYEIEYKGERKALKVVKQKGKEGTSDLKEIDILTRLRHPGLAHADEILSEYNSQTDQVVIFIIMPLAQSDLYKAIVDDTFSTGEKIAVLTEVTRGLAFLHSQSYLHMDIKPLNILVFDNYKTGKLSDFGLALRLEKDRKTFPVSLMTVDHRSINILEGSRTYTTADDIWSLGVTMLETFSGKSPFAVLKKNEYTKENVSKIVREVFSPDRISLTLKKYFRKVPPLFKDKIIRIVTAMLSFRPEDRPTAAQVLSELTRQTEIGGAVLATPVLPPSLCDALILYGYNTMVKLCSKIWTRLETFFLAADLYQRSLAYRRPSSGDLNQDIVNSTFQGVLSVYMAVKVIESFQATPEKLTELTGNLFRSEDLIIGESHLITGFGGHIYRNNIFTNSTTVDRFQLGFELTRNCKVYSKIDMAEWKEFDQQEAQEGAEIYPNKWKYFVDFLETTPYHDVLYANPPIDVEQIYASEQ